MFGNDVKIGVLEQHVEQLEKEVAELQEVVGKLLQILIAKELQEDD